MSEAITALLFWFGLLMGLVALLIGVSSFGEALQRKADSRPYKTELAEACTWVIGALATWFFLS